MNSLKTFTTKLHQSPRKCTCIHCRTIIPIGHWHFRIVANLGNVSFKLCKQCIRKLNTAIMWEDSE